MKKSTKRTADAATLEREPLWYRDAVIYQVHVRAFADSDGNGIGDFQGLAGKLDYLRDLGVTAIWILPFYPSPLRDDGYDIADYYGVHPDYGTLSDFRHFLREAHARGLRVITELVLNHTSDQHPWFQRARRAPRGSSHRDFYVWNDNDEKYADARIIFKDFEDSNWSWDSVAGAYFWHRFYRHQPDLNFANPAVRKALFHVVDYWLAMGVDGMRLDAVPYLHEREGTNCENLPETHAALKELRRHVDARFDNRMLLAEANQWPEDAVAYFGDGDECHMAFHFPLMPRMFMALRMEDRYPLLDILAQTPAIPDVCQWAVFLRNHDELTLEMVTDEERDYMYRVFANDPRARINLGIRRRLAPLLDNDRRRIELMNGLLFSLPGTPVVYYGDEIGMGDNIWLGDRNGVRTPMHWSGDRNAGFSRANAQRLYLPVIIDPDFHYEALNVEAQANNASSLLWWMRRTIAHRRRLKALGRGSLEFLYPDNRKVLAFIRSYDDETILVVANLSRHAQFAELDLSPYEGLTPVELSGMTRFPKVGGLPYLLTLGPHAFYWFRLETVAEEGPSLERDRKAAPPPRIRVKAGVDALVRADGRETLEALLPAHLRGRRWFGGKARAIESVRIEEAVSFGEAARDAWLVLIEVAYVEGDPETYLLPIAFVAGDEARRLDDIAPGETLAHVVAPKGEGILTNALLLDGCCSILLEAVARRRKLKGGLGEIVARPTRAFRRLADGAEALTPSLLKAEQSNSSVLFGDRFIMKLYRRLDEGIQPDVEIGRFLTERAGFEHTAPLAGVLEYLPRRGETVTLGALQGFAPNEGDAWRYTLDSLDRYFDRVAAVQDVEPPDGWQAPLLDLASLELPDEVRQPIGVYLESARLLGRRTGEMHVALASGGDDPAFALEPFSPMVQRSVYQSMRNEAVRALDLLRKGTRSIPADARDAARAVLDAQTEILGRFKALLAIKMTARRMRIHGDFHLGQVLFTGKDFVIIDFEGEPAHTVSARRLKRSPLRDVAGMLRSFHYAASTAMQRPIEAGTVPSHAVARVERWAAFWRRWVSATFLGAYLEASAEGGFLPRGGDELRVLLRAYLLEKAMYELAYELNNRPDWVRLPLAGILELLERDD